MIRLFLVDDHPVVRQGLAAVLEDEADFQIVCTADSAQKALESAYECRPDVLVLDLEMPDGNGMMAIPDLLRLLPALRILVFTAYETEELVVSAVRAGAAGYLLKGAAAAEIANAIRTVHAGRTSLEARIACKIIAQVAGRGDIPVRLTPRETQVLKGVAEGMPNKQIAHRFGISERTVKFHMTSVFQKLDAENRAQAVAIATRNQLL